MTETFKESVERWRVPISIGKGVSIIVFFVTATWFLVNDRATFEQKLSYCETRIETVDKDTEISIAKLQKDTAMLIATDNQKNIVLAEIQKDLKYISAMLEKMERRDGIQ
jgi:hypothetical protein